MRNNQFIKIISGIGLSLFALFGTSSAQEGRLPTSRELENKLSMEQAYKDAYSRTSVHGKHLLVTGPEQDCPGALSVCQQTYTQSTAYTGFGSQQELSNTCLLLNEGNSVWYRFTAQTSGTLSFMLNTATDYDFAMYDITTIGCAGVPSAVPVRCNYSSTLGNTGLTLPASATIPISVGAAGIPTMPAINVTAGQTFALVVDNFAGDATGYSITFGGTAQIFDNTPPVLGIIPPVCNGSSLFLTLSELIQCSSIAANGSDFTMTGPGAINVPVTSANGNLCSPVGACTNLASINFNSSGLTAGTYTVNIQTGTDGNTLIDKCGNAMLPAQSITFKYLPPAPGPAGSITGTQVLCSGAGGLTYSTATIANAISYSWSYSGTGLTITAGATTNTITVAFSATATSGNLTVSGSNGCSNGTNSPPLAITVKPTPNITSTTPAQRCSTGGPVNLGAVASAGTINWYAAATGGASLGTGTLFPVSNASTATYFVDATSGSCTTVPRTGITVTVFTSVPSAPGSIIGLVKQCPVLTSQSYSITAVLNSTKYVWTVPAGWTITSGAGTTAIVVTTGSASQNGNITVTAGNACGTSAAVVLPVTVSTPASLIVSASSTTICAGTSALITANPVSGVSPYTYSWGPAASLSGTTGVSETATPAVNTTYTIVLTDKCGSKSTSNIAITIFTAPAVSVVSAATSVCAGSSDLLTAKGAQGKSPYTYSWTPSTGLNSTTSASVLSTPVLLTTYTVTATDNCGLKASRIVSVNVAAPPFVAAVSASAADTLDVTISKQIKCGSIDPNGSDFFILSGPTGLNIVSAAGIGCTASQPFTNTIKLTLSGSKVSGTFGIGVKKGTDGNTILDTCSAAIDSIATTPFDYTATQSPDCPIKIYSGLSPNMDGHNDSWIIDCIESEPNNQVTIINRWGQQVWQASNYDNSTVVWKGTDKQGQALSDGTYFYEVKLSWKTYKGRVEIVR
jgi:gliding motility-associated-like protein